jgi:hypothetical protein
MGAWDDTTAIAGIVAYKVPPPECGDSSYNAPTRRIDGTFGHRIGFNSAGDCLWEAVETSELLTET